jgi:hypothetical protein
MTSNQILNQKPKNIALAVRLLWGTLAFGILNGFLNLDFTMSQVQVPPNFPMDKGLFALLVTLPTLAIPAWIILKTSSGRNWARVFLLIGYIIGIPMSVPHLIALFHHSKLAALVTAILWILQLTALCLLFSKEGNAWFKAQKAARKK